MPPPPVVAACPLATLTVTVKREPLVGGAAAFATIVKITNTATKAQGGGAADTETAKDFTGFKTGQYTVTVEPASDKLHYFKPESAVTIELEEGKTASVEILIHPLEITLVTPDAAAATALVGEAKEWRQYLNLELTDEDKAKGGLSLVPHDVSKQRATSALEAAKLEKARTAPLCQTATDDAEAKKTKLDEATVKAAASKKKVADARAVAATAKTTSDDAQLAKTKAAEDARVEAAKVAPVPPDLLRAHQARVAELAADSLAADTKARDDLAKSEEAAAKVGPLEPQVLLDETALATAKSAHDAAIKAAATAKDVDDGAAVWVTVATTMLADAKDMDPLQLGRTLKVSAKLNVELAGVKIHFDVKTDGNKVRGGIAPAAKEGFTVKEVLTNAKGIAETDFQLSRFGGDKYVVVASLLASPKTNGKAVESRQIAGWRKLWFQTSYNVATAVPSLAPAIKDFAGMAVEAEAIDTRPYHFSTLVGVTKTQASQFDSVPVSLPAGKSVPVEFTLEAAKVKALGAVETATLSFRTRTGTLTRQVILATAAKLKVVEADNFEPATKPVGGFAGSITKTYTIRNEGTAPLDFTAGKAQPWLTISPASGTVAGGATQIVTATIGVDLANGLAKGDHTDTLTFRNLASPADDVTRSVKLAASDAPTGVLSVTSREDFLSAGVQGGAFATASEAYTLANLGTAALQFTVRNVDNRDWLAFSCVLVPVDGKYTLAAGATTTVDVKLVADKAAAAVLPVSGQVEFKDVTNNKVATRAATLGTAAKLTLTGVDLAKTAKVGLFAAPTTTYTLKNDGHLPLDYAVTKTAAWLSLTNAAGTLAAGATADVVIKVDADIAKTFEVGVTEDTLTFTGGGPAVTKKVTLTATANPDPVVCLLPLAPVSVTGTVGGAFAPETLTFTLKNIGGGSDFGAPSANKAWIAKAATPGEVVCVGSHNSDKLRALRRQADTQRPKTAHLVVCDQQWDPNDGALIDIQSAVLTFEQTASVGVFKPTLDGKPLVTCGTWEWKTGPGGATTHRGSIGEDHLEIPPNRWNPKTFRLKLPAVCPAACPCGAAGTAIAPTAGSKVAVKLTLHGADGPYLGEGGKEESPHCLIVLQKGEPDDFNDTTSHELAHMFNAVLTDKPAQQQLVAKWDQGLAYWDGQKGTRQTALNGANGGNRVALQAAYDEAVGGVTQFTGLKAAATANLAWYWPDGIPTHPHWYTGMGTHCGTGATKPPGSSAHGEDAYADGSCIMYHSGRPLKLSWCDDCKELFHFTDMRRMSL